MIVLLELATVGKFLNKKLTYFFDRLNRAMIGRVRTNRQGKISILINIFFTIGFKFKLKKVIPVEFLAPLLLHGRTPSEAVVKKFQNLNAKNINMKN